VNARNTKEIQTVVESALLSVRELPKKDSVFLNVKCTRETSHAAIQSVSQQLPFLLFPSLQHRNVNQSACPKPRRGNVQNNARSTKEMLTAVENALTDARRQQKKESVLQNVKFIRGIFAVVTQQPKQQLVLPRHVKQFACLKPRKENVRLNVRNMKVILIVVENVLQSARKQQKQAHVSLNAKYIKETSSAAIPSAFLRQPSPQLRYHREKNVSQFACLKPRKVSVQVNVRNTKVILIVVETALQSVRKQLVKENVFLNVKNTKEIFLAAILFNFQQPPSHQSLNHQLQRNANPFACLRPRKANVQVNVDNTKETPNVVENAPVNVKLQQEVTSAYHSVKFIQEM